MFELMGPVLGFGDTDNPAVSANYLRQYRQFYALAAVSVFIMALAYIVASFAISHLDGTDAASIMCGTHLRSFVLANQSFGFGGYRGRVFGHCAGR
ncbi:MULTISPECIES: hypothetical protein [unclassified Cryobacterium]|uniref:hypothetical protein n=1 Tax=unclassified Cryobacterium TaxID=2649013 RepID=UPI0011AFF8AE|nr:MULTISPECIES: hypothetical protein [unclassified Cryobacterium]